jgi:hypothetical protein
VQLNISSRERTLLKDAAREIREHITELWVDRLDRVGFTPSRLFVVYLDGPREGSPFVVKIDTAKRIRREASAAQEVQGSFPGEVMTARHIARARGKAAILYPLHTSHPETENVTEFKDLIFEPASIGDEERTRLCVNHIQKLYEEVCHRAHHSGEEKLVELGEEFKDYLRGEKGDRPTFKLRALFGRRSRRTHREFLGADIADPRHVRGALLPLKPLCRVADIHGDLHPNNIVIGPSEPHLVDFAWGKHRAHVLKDYVLLETSLRFLLFPRWGGLDRQLEMDRLLLSEDGPARVIDDSAGPLAPYQVRLAGILQVIRRAARDAWGTGYSFDHYLLAQFLVLYGVLSYDDYNFPVAVRALGLIGDAVMTRVNDGAYEAA